MRSLTVDPLEPSWDRRPFGPVSSTCSLAALASSSFHFSGISFLSAFDCKYSIASLTAFGPSFVLRLVLPSLFKTSPSNYSSIFCKWGINDGGSDLVLLRRATNSLSILVATAELSTILIIRNKIYIDLSVSKIKEVKKTYN